MQVHIKRTRRRVQCRYCEKFIEVGEFQVVCTYFMKLKHSEKIWTKRMHFHAKNPYCWVEQGVIEVGRKVYVENRGRKPDAISDENKAKRRQILRRRASVIQRIKYELLERQRSDKLGHLVDMLDKLIVEIAPFGGVPKSWVKVKET